MRSVFPHSADVYSVLRVQHLIWQTERPKKERHSADKKSINILKKNKTKLSWAHLVDFQSRDFFSLMAEAALSACSKWVNEKLVFLVSNCDSAGFCTIVIPLCLPLPVYLRMVILFRPLTGIQMLEDELS